MLILPQVSELELLSSNCRSHSGYSGVALRHMVTKEAIAKAVAKQERPHGPFFFARQFWEASWFSLRIIRIGDFVG